MKRILFVTALSASACMGTAQASMPLSIGGLVNPQVTADVDFGYQSISDILARITISIHNTTPTSVGGRITAFAFNVPTLVGITITSIGGDGDDIGPQQPTALGAPNESGWHGRFDYGNIKTPNAAGDFDYGVMNASSTNAFITDGVGTSSAPKIVLDETTTFTLDIVGTGLDNFTNSVFENAFLSELSTGGSAGAFSFGIRFQGVQDSNGNTSDLGVPTQIVPVPGSVLLVLFGVSTVALGARSRPGRLCLQSA